VFEVGDNLTALVVDNVDPGRMKTMAMLLEDPNPIHWDTSVIRALGLGDQPINQGPINLGYLMEMVVRNLAGGAASLKRFRVRFVGNVVAGQRVECAGQVTAVDTAAGTAELSLNATADGEPALIGDATVLIV
jgi:acyl dehydratase